MNRFKYFRERHGLTLEEIGKKLGVTKATVHKWENGTLPVGLKYYDKLMAIFQVDEITLCQKILGIEPQVDYAEIQLENHLINQEHYGADVTNEIHQLRQLEKTIDDPNYPEDYKKAAKQQALELQTQIDTKTAAAKQRLEMPSSSPRSIPPFPGTVHPPHEVALVEQSRLKQIPIMGFAQAAGYDPALEPIVDFVRNNSDETAEFLIDGPTDGYFALTVDGDSMSPEYPHGTRLLVAGNEYPQRGDVVVALLRTGQVIVKDYWRKNNIITLSSENQNGQNFEWNCKEDPGYILWMKPVIKVELDLRRRRWERTQAGI